MTHVVLAPAAGWDLQKPSRAEGNLVKVFFLYCSVLYDLNITDIVSKPGQFMNRNLGKFISELHPFSSELCLNFSSSNWTYLIQESGDHLLGVSCHVSHVQCW